MPAAQPARRSLAAVRKSPGTRRQGRGRRHRRHPARQVHPQGQVRFGGRRRLRLLRRRVRLGHARPVLRQHDAHRLAQGLSGRDRAPRPRDAPQRAVGRRRRLLPRRLRSHRRKGGEEPVPARPAAGAEARAGARGEARRSRRCARWSSSGSTSPRRRNRGRRRKGVGPEPITPGMFGYSLLRANHAKRLLQGAVQRDGRVRHPDRGPAHRNRSGRVRGRDHLFARRSRRRTARSCSRPARRRSARASASCRASWRSGAQQYPGLLGPRPPESLSDGKKNVFHDAKGRDGMSKLFESYLAGQIATLLEFAPMFWPTINSYKRLVDGFWAPVKPTWGIDNRTASFRVIPGSPKSTRLETRCPGADVNPYLAMAACVAAGLYGIEKKLKLTAPPIHGTNLGAENIPRAPRTLIETTRIFKASERRARLVRRRVRRSFRGDPRMGMAAVAGRGDRLGTEALLRDHLSKPMQKAFEHSVPDGSSALRLLHREGFARATWGGPASPAGKSTQQRASCARLRITGRRCLIAMLFACFACLSPADAKTLRFASAFDPQTMDPHSLALLYHSRVSTQIYEALVNRDRDFVLEAVRSRCRGRRSIRRPGGSSCGRTCVSTTVRR